MNIKHATSIDFVIVVVSIVPINMSVLTVIYVNDNNVVSTMLSNVLLQIITYI